MDRAEKDGWLMCGVHFALALSYGLSGVSIQVDVAKGGNSSRIVGMCWVARAFEVCYVYWSSWRSTADQICKRCVAQAKSQWRRKDRF